ncbi:stage III sporulation protein AF [Cohnella sp. REN36]|uniref:stage III sporulation protein AF n=1 Tax=Cohnella sp. REN36 TaxID=2887347 RepID=UPI001D154E6B|nr:stage III sporulation protein AF [Cohnella sp. REN36]MCC3373387.1 stage III sporulation protein AF [Cohnella sp. REN36]
MMVALSGWLKQVVAVVLLASLIDLLLPNRAMQRYVRLVAGLFILLTIAAPMLQWIKGDFGAKLSAGIAAVERQPDTAPNQLAQIEADAGRLRASRDDQASRLAAVMLEGEIRTTVEQETGLRVDKVTVALAGQPDGAMTATGVTVQLGDAPAGADGGKGNDGSAPGEIRPVAPIRVELPDIEIGAPATDGEAGQPDGREAVPAASQTAEPTEADQAERNRVAAIVAARFGIRTDAIKVTRPAAGDAY